MNELEPQHFQSNSIFWVDVDKIRPNPYQPRREFDENRLRDMADSIRQYGVLMPLVVTRQEFEKEDGGLQTIYELIAGERRLRASKMAGISQVPVVIRASQNSDKEKLELAIIENLQREDLNPMDRARAFDQLNREFGMTHQEIGKKIGRSREYVSNTTRLLSLPIEMQEALSQGKITEGHTRPLLMLMDRPQEQTTLFREIMLKKITVREAERISRTIAFERRRKAIVNPRLEELEEMLTERLGTRVHIEQKPVGGKITIDYFSVNDVEQFLGMLSRSREKQFKTQIDNELPQENEGWRAEINAPKPFNEIMASPIDPELATLAKVEELVKNEFGEVAAPADDRSRDEKSDDDLYAVSNFSI